MQKGVCKSQKLSNELVDSFNVEAAPNGGKLTVGGRLGEYRYYDMDKSIAAALTITIISRDGTM